MIDHADFILSKIDPGADDLEPCQIVQGNLRQWYDEIIQLRERIAALEAGDPLANVKLSEENDALIDRMDAHTDMLMARLEELERALRTFADPANWYDHVGCLQWAGKRHAVDYAEAMLRTVNSGLLDPLRLKRSFEALEPALNMWKADEISDGKLRECIRTWVRGEGLPI